MVDKALVVMGSQYSDYQRRQSVVLYLLFGNLTRVSESMDIPAATIGHWKAHTDWWEVVETEVRALNQDQIEAAQTNIIIKASNIVLDRLSNGDPVVLPDGKIVHRGVSARDATMVAGTFFDKRQILNNKPTSIRATEGRLDDLMQKFAEIGKRVVEAKVIDIEVVDNSDE